MRQRGKGYRLLRGLAAALMLAAALGAAAVWWWLNQPLSLARPSIEVSIEAGSTPRDVAQAWVDAGVQTDASWLYAWFRVSGQARRIRAGSYEIEPGTTPRTLLEVLVQGRETLQTVRLLEGWTLRQVRDALAAAPNLKATTRAWDDARLMQEIGAPGVSAEGRFFPDTYAYARGVSDLTVLRRAYRTMQQRLAAVWADRSGDTPLKSADEALILASIVEKETGTATDRPLIAGVFINRLRLGMPLQTDPTVIYGLGDRFDGNLRKRDLLADTPFNTYTRSGLPPTPIALPGMASLRAAVRPEATKALYFVARGDGSSAFSDTLAEHNRAVNRYQRGQP
ncbi:MAG: endolytic transglycosylase MltG [Rubrivivax sp.]|nr:endolytic transglycosylase MltG [Rubrivivax sp.]